MSFSGKVREELAENIGETLPDSGDSGIYRNVRNRRDQQL